MFYEIFIVGMHRNLSISDTTDDKKSSKWQHFRFSYKFYDMCLPSTVGLIWCGLSTDVSEEWYQLWQRVSGIIRRRNGSELGMCRQGTESIPKWLGWDTAEKPIILIDNCKTVVSPVRKQWRYQSLPLSYKCLHYIICFTLFWLRYPFRWESYILMLPATYRVALWGGYYEQNNLIKLTV